MAIHTPVIVSKLPWVNEKFVPGKHILTVDANDSNDLANNICKVIKGDYNIDIKDAYKIIKKKLDMRIENQKLLDYYYSNLIK